MSLSRIVIASRESRLALWQAEHIREALARLLPAARVSILGMTTQGDRILDRPLAQIGGKGLFIKELEVAMAEGRADLAVHSMKDVPMVMPEGFVLAAIPVREDPRDAFVSERHADLESLPPGAVVGTSSLRREAVLRARRPDLEIRSLRGNLDTRLKKLDAGEYDAIVLAAAGLIRLGLGARIRALLPPEVFLPAPGQGALGIELSEGRMDLLAALAPLNDAATAACVRAERAFSRALGGSCQLPLGGYAVIDAPEASMASAQTPWKGLWLRGFVATPDGRSWVRGELRAEPGETPEALGQRLADHLRAEGAEAILSSLAACP